ncbi:MAG TPA: cytochrome c [Edaphocola sp.]|nr:cytochrome c [Edaphocola sp.]
MSDKIKWIIIIGLLSSFIFYSVHLYQSSCHGKQSSSPLAQKGKMIWQQKNCVSCHQFYGLGGHLGPDLTNVYSKREPEFIKAFLRSGTVVMPNFNLNDQEIDALLAFFQYTDSTGISDPKSFIKHIDGTISQK